MSSASVVVATISEARSDSLKLHRVISHSLSPSALLLLNCRQHAVSLSLPASTCFITGLITGLHCGSRAARPPQLENVDILKRSDVYLEELIPAGPGIRMLDIFSLMYTDIRMTFGC